MAGAYRSLDFTDTFLETFASRDLKPAERKLLLKALRLLDENKRHPSLRVHKLEGDRQGAWSVSASDVLRMTFARLEDGRKRMLTCGRHYDR
jgi:plasmid maintenance system killer protein